MHWNSFPNIAVASIIWMLHWCIFLLNGFDVLRQSGQLKAHYRLLPADPAREKYQIARLRSLAEQADLDPEFAEQCLTFIIAEVIQHHKKQAHTLQGNPH